MTAISYRDYASDLEGRLQKLRTFETAATIEIAICRNGFCFKSAETTGPTATRRYSFGPLNSAVELRLEDGTETLREIAQFFALPEIYAYSDAALRNDRTPLSRAHWDGTLALVEVRYETAVTTWHQRMLFIGFSDPIHADFTIGIDDDIFVDGTNKGRQLFEWRVDESRSDVPPRPSTPYAEAIRTPKSPTFRERFASVAVAKWLPRRGAHTPSAATKPNALR